MAYTLQDLASSYLERKSPALAQPYADEALAVCGQLWKSDPGKYADDYAKDWLMQASLLEQQAASCEIVTDAARRAESAASAEDVKRDARKFLESCTRF